MKKSTEITLKSHWLEIIRPFSFSVKGEVIDAVYTYLTTGEIIALSETAAMAFAFIRHEIDDAAARREARVAARRKNKDVSSVDKIELQTPCKSSEEEAKSPIPPRTQPMGLQSLVKQVLSQNAANSDRRLPRKLKKRIQRRLKCRNRPSSR